MAQDILINVGAAEIRVAIAEGGKLQMLTCAPVLETERSSASHIGDIILGRISRIVPAIQAAFVDIGMEKAGFLAAREARSLRHTAPDAPISQMLTEGEAVIVQIAKDMIGDKGPRLTASVTLPGRLLVLTPMQAGVSLSRRITDEAERARLLALGEQVLQDGAETLCADCGFILRTNAYGADYNELSDEAQTLCAAWRTIQQAATDARPPRQIYRDLGVVEKALRDLSGADTANIILDDALTAERARIFCRETIPHMAERISVFTGPGALFDRDEIETEIATLAHPRVPLPCGGWIMVQGTEALTAVDVNSGSFVTASDQENTVLQVNMEAADEIGRQVRLRGIGGVIVIDFIHMRAPEHMDAVCQRLEKSLTWDGRAVIMAPPSPFGLVEVTRKRLREPYEKLTSTPCHTCHGEARLRRPAAIAQDVIRRIESTVRAVPGAAIRVSAAPEVIGWLTAQGESLKQALASKGAVDIAWETQTYPDREAFDVETVTR